MSIRDIIVTLIVFGSLPFILRQPHIGVLMWSWLSYMNPHRLCWGFAYDLPFAQIVAITLLIALLLSKEPKRVPVTPLTVIWWVFLAWMCITTAFAFDVTATTQLDKVLKIQVVTFLTIMLMGQKQRLLQLIWVIVLSLGFYGVKGGLFTLVTAGHFHVWGPPHSFIEDNNALAAALLMVLPLMYYLRSLVENGWAKRGLAAAMVLCAFSIIGSQSRGALLGAGAMALFLVFKAGKRFQTAVAVAIVAATLLLFAPRSWYARMDTIDAYHQDASAMGRINAWWYSFNLANHRITGGGFESWNPETFARYAPNPTDVHVAHSIYFGVLADHGWPGLILFVSILALGWRTANWTVKNAKPFGDLDWLIGLNKMVQVSLVAYCTAGAFLSLSYFDLPWHLIAIVVLGKEITNQRLNQAPVQPSHTTLRNSASDLRRSGRSAVSNAVSSTRAAQSRAEGAPHQAGLLDSEHHRVRR
jgi:putative inorganic carbon (HCO3(-)) transporter